MFEHDIRAVVRHIVHHELKREREKIMATVQELNDKFAALQTAVDDALEVVKTPAATGIDPADLDPIVVEMDALRSKIDDAVAAHTAPASVAG